MSTYYSMLSPERKREYIRRAADREREARKDPVYRERKNARRRELRHTDEYRDKRRAAYAAKHANDQMTPRRLAIIEAMKRIVELRRKEGNYGKEL